MAQLHREILNVGLQKDEEDWYIIFLDDQGVLREEGELPHTGELPRR